MPQQGFALKLQKHFVENSWLVSSFKSTKLPKRQFAHGFLLHSEDQSKLLLLKK